MTINRIALKTFFFALAFVGYYQEGRCELIFEFSATRPDFEFFSTHPDALTQPTVRGSTLSSIDLFGNELYFGYGDWAADWGPISIRSLNPSTGAWSPQLLSVGTEAITHYRQIGGSSYAVMVDPRGPPGVNPGGYALGTPTGSGTTSWSQAANIPGATHCFDIAGGAGNDLWVVGSSGTSGAVWRSVDNGQTFSVARLDGPAPGSQPFVFSRYTGVVEFMGREYVQRLDVNGAHVATSLVFDGTSWSDGPDLISASNGFVFRPQQFDGKLVYLDGDLGSNSLYRFDGTQSLIAYPQQIRDFNIKDGVLIALTASGEITSTRDLNTWTILGLAPANSQSLAFNNQFIVTGTSNGQVFRADFSVITAVPEASSFALFAVSILIAGGISFRRFSFSRGA